MKKILLSMMVCILEGEFLLQWQGEYQRFFFDYCIVSGGLLELRVKVSQYFVERVFSRNLELVDRVYIDLVKVGCGYF